MSAFEIYLIMQLDSVITAAFLLAVVSGFIALVTLGTWLGEEISGWVPLLFGVVFTITGTLCTLLPSTKTAAAMFIVPAIMNNEMVQAEAGELYQLAKDALKNAVKEEKKYNDNDHN